MMFEGKKFGKLLKILLAPLLVNRDLLAKSINYATTLQPRASPPPTNANPSLLWRGITPHL